MKDQILEIVEQHPKQFSQIIKRDKQLYSCIKDSHGDSIAEKAYNTVYNESQICKNNSHKKFRSFRQGYGFCGSSKQCACARESVSQKVSAAKQSYTPNQKNLISEKRQETNLKKYGVANTAQTETAKAKHAEFYADQSKVNTAVEQAKKTKLLKYGNSTYNNAKKIKQTWQEKYSDSYWNNFYPDKELETLADKNTLLELYKQKSIPEIAQHCNVHIQTVYKYLNKHKLRDPFSSSEETEVVKYLQSLGIQNIVRNTRKLLPSRKEIDIYLPDYNLAIEYNGVYWHHEDVDHITKSYHADKFQECENLGIQLITIFSNFWKSQPNRVKQILRNRLGIDAQKIYARNCSIEYITTKQAKTFFQQNHIQGYSVSSVRLGLFEKDQLVAAMTFSRPRTGIGKSEKGWELVRFASSTRVVGGASKLLRHFIKDYSPECVTSYSDNEWSNGNLYKTLGFDLESNIPASYWYLKPREERFYHRYNFAKHKLVEKGHDATLTEREITRQIGLLKVWDCGKKKWKLNCKL